MTFLTTVKMTQDEFDNLERGLEQLKDIDHFTNLFENVIRDFPHDTSFGFIVEVVKDIIRKNVKIVERN